MNHKKQKLSNDSYLEKWHERKVIGMIMEKWKRNLRMMWSQILLSK